MSYDYPDVNIRCEHGIGLLRETLRCHSCAATMRDRQMAHGLLLVIRERLGQDFPDLAAFSADSPLRIHDSDSFSPINRVLRGRAGYVHTQFDPVHTNGDTLSDGSVMVDLERIPFPESSFDVVLTSDVMEHVTDDESAHSSISRVLATGGSYIFTVPYAPVRSAIAH